MFQFGLSRKVWYSIFYYLPDSYMNIEDFRKILEQILGLFLAWKFYERGVKLYELIFISFPPPRQA